MSLPLQRSTLPNIREHAMKTYRRDKLRRLVEAGKVETVSTYHFDDMTGGDRSPQVYARGGYTSK